MSDDGERARRVARDLMMLPLNWSTEDLRRRVAAVQSEVNRGSLDAWSRKDVDDLFGAVDALRRRRGDVAARQTFRASVTATLAGSVVLPTALKFGAAALALAGVAALPPLFAAAVVYLRGRDNAQAAEEMKTLADDLRRLCTSRPTPGAA